MRLLGGRRVGVIDQEVMVMMMCYGMIGHANEISERSGKLLLEHDSSQAALNVAWLG